MAAITQSICVAAKCLLLYASWLLNYIFLHSPSAKLGNPASSIWKHFYAARFSDERGIGMVEVWFAMMCWKKHIFPSEADWTRFHVTKVVSRKDVFSSTLPPLHHLLKSVISESVLTLVKTQNPEDPGFFFFFFFPIMLNLSGGLRFLQSAPKWAQTRSWAVPWGVRDHTKDFLK